MNEEIIKRLKLHFIAKGYFEMPVDTIDESLKPDLSFKNGEETTFVNVINLDTIQDRTKFFKKLMSLVAMREICNEVYVALPKILATQIDTAPFKDRGIGILTINDTIIEVLKARKTKRREEIEEKIMEKIEKLEIKIKQIEDAVINIEEEVNKLSMTRAIQKTEPEDARLNYMEEELTKIKRKLEELTDKTKKTKKEERKIKKKDNIKDNRHALEKEPNKSSMEYPSFFKDNPWIKIISSRRKEK